MAVTKAAKQCKAVVTTVLGRHHPLEFSINDREIELERKVQELSTQVARLRRSVVIGYTLIGVFALLRLRPMTPGVLRLLGVAGFLALAAYPAVAGLWGGTRETIREAKGRGEEDEHGLTD